MYEIKYTKEQLDHINQQLAIKHHKMKDMSLHYNAKVMKIDLQMQSLNETVRTMVLQYYEFNCMIREFEELLRYMDARQLEDFEHVDIDRMKEDQWVRLQSIRLILDVPLPGMPDVKWMKQKEVVECSS